MDLLWMDFSITRRIQRKTTLLDGENRDRKEKWTIMQLWLRELETYLVFLSCWCWRWCLCYSISEMIIRRLQWHTGSHYKHSSLCEKFSPNKFFSASMLPLSSTVPSLSLQLSEKLKDWKVFYFPFIPSATHHILPLLPSSSRSFPLAECLDEVLLLILSSGGPPLCIDDGCVGVGSIIWAFCLMGQIRAYEEGMTKKSMIV